MKKGLKRFMAGCLALLVMLTILPATGLLVKADAKNITLSDATYYASGALKSLTTTFDWTSEDADMDCLLVLMKNKLSGGDSGDYGDFTNF